MFRSQRPQRVPATKYPQRDIRIAIPGARQGAPGVECDIRYIDTGGSGVPLLYLHGHGARLEEAETLFDALVARGRRVIAFDLPCCGYSERVPPTERRYTVEFFCRATRALIEKLALPEVVLVGGSLGGNLAIRLAASGDPRMRAAIVWQPASAWPGPPSLPMLGALPMPLTRALRKPGLMFAARSTQSKCYRNRAFDVPEFDDSGQPEWTPSKRERVLGVDREMHREVWDPLFHRAYFDIASAQLRSSIFPIARKVRIPVLVLAAKYDNGPPEWLFHGTRKIDRILRRARPGRPEDWLVEVRSGHSVHAEAPQGLSRRIVEFLDRVLGK